MAIQNTGGSKTGTRNSEAGGDVPLTVTNLKFIGAAFDVAIEDLQAMQVNVREDDREAVAQKIEALQKLKADTNRECPQSWYVRFEAV